MVFYVLAVCHFVIPMFVYIGDDFCDMGVVVYIVVIFYVNAICVK